MDFQSKRIRERVEYFLIFATAGMSLIIAVLDLSGLLDANSWVTQRVPSLTLLAVGFIASYLVWERQGKIDSLGRSLEESKSTILERIENSAQHIIKALDGVEVMSFANKAEMNEYVAKRFQKAQRIDDVNWGNKLGQKQSPLRSHEDIESYRKYNEAINAFVTKTTTVWREVVVFHSAGRFEREKRRILAKENTAYNARFYEMPTETAPNLQGFIIVDNAELLISHSRSFTWLCIKHPLIVKFFIGYFEDLWQGAKILKEGKYVDHQQLATLETKLVQIADRLIGTNAD